MKRVGRKLSIRAIKRTGSNVIVVTLSPPQENGGRVLLLWREVPGRR